MESVYELERENDVSWLYSEHRTKELFQQRFVWLSQRLQRSEHNSNEFAPRPSSPHPREIPMLIYTSGMRGVYGVNRSDFDLD